MLTMLDVFESLHDLVDENLIPSRPLQALFPILETLPLVSSVILETHLNRGRRIDLSFNLNAMDGSQERFAKLIRVVPNETETQTKAWKFLIDCCDTLGSNDSEHPLGFSGIWVELDSDTSDSLQTPNIFLVFAPGIIKEGINSLLEMLNRLRVFGPGDLRTITHFCRSLPHNARLDQFGIMFGRKQMIKINVSGIESGRISDLLECVGWPGDNRRLCGLTERLCDDKTCVEIDFDFHNGSLLPSMGFEFAYSRHARNHHLWNGLLNRMLKEGLFTLDDYNSLVPWTAAVTKTYPGSACRSHESEPVRWICSRRLNHLKISHSSNAVAQTKAYLSLVRVEIDQTL